jgi:hypothetical protein
MARTIVLLIFISILALAASPGYAAPDPADACKEAKLKAAGKKAAALLKAIGKNTKSPNSVQLDQGVSKARSKFTKAFAKAEGKGGCQTTGDVGTVETQIDTDVAELLGILCPPTTTTSTTTTTTFSTTTTLCPLVCPQFPATGQTTCWDSSSTVVACGGTGHDGDIQAGATLSYTDNGDGTITDTNTGLMWEKKSDDGSIHDKDTFYTWDDAFAVHVAGLNASGGFAGHTDWRVPNAKELQSIVDYERVNPSIDPAFNTACVASCTVMSCSCTASSFYWSSTSYAANPFGAWLVNFLVGFVSTQGKIGNFPVRAVRGGL